LFSGIVETTSLAQSVFAADKGIQIVLDRPSIFDDIALGDSIATNGVCLTITSFDESSMAFFIGAETLSVTGWTVESLMTFDFNLERSLKLSDRIHGSLVSGHVDAVAKVLKSELFGENLLLDVSYPVELSSFVWKKGSVVINGVSLTINELSKESLSVCLVPETLMRTNLSKLCVGDCVNLEADYIAKAITRREETKAYELHT